MCGLAFFLSTRFLKGWSAQERKTKRQQGGEYWKSGKENAYSRPVPLQTLMCQRITWDLESNTDSDAAGLGEGLRVCFSNVLLAGWRCCCCCPGPRAEHKVLGWAGKSVYFKPQAAADQFLLETQQNCEISLPSSLPVFSEPGCWGLGSPTLHTLSSAKFIRAGSKQRQACPEPSIDSYENLWTGSLYIRPGSIFSTSKPLCCGLNAYVPQIHVEI